METGFITRTITKGINSRIEKADAGLAAGCSLLVEQSGEAGPQGGRATGAADGGQALADWLATSGITVKGATFAEAVTVLRLQADEKLGPIATALGVA